MDIGSIQQRILVGKYVVSFTHTEKLRRRRMSLATIEEIVRVGEIIEEYPFDPRGPSCLILGVAPTGRPIHVVCGNLESEEILIITAYEPTPEEWELDWKTRKKGNTL
jgi:hypothetical protein